MQFTQLSGGGRNDSKAARFALIAGLHVALGALFIHSINTKTLALSSLKDQVLVMIEPDHPTPPPPSEPPQPPQQLAPPDLVIPQPVIDVAPPPTPSPIQATTESAPNPFPAAPSAPEAPAAPAAPAANSGNPGQMHTAVFADADGCALPDYPAAAARRGDSGTTTLALLVGADGRVSSARVEKSSGSRDLDRAAINALSLCRFKPATSNGVAQAGWAKLAYVWTLD